VEDDEKVEVTKQKKAASRSTSGAVKKMKDNLEKTTLGDLDALSQLKTKMEEDEKKSGK
jgi:small subunit ribosomal protein S1